MDSILLHKCTLTPISSSNSDGLLEVSESANAYPGCSNGGK